MSFHQYLAESQRRREFVSEGDDFDIVVNEELCLEFTAIAHDHDSCLVEADDHAVSILEDCGCTFSDDLSESEEVDEAEYAGRKVQLGKPTKGDVKKFKVFVRNPKTGNIKKVNFGDPNMEIKRDDPKRRKSFRARHGCGTPRASDRTKAAYWSCRMWSKKPVSKIV